MRKNIVILGLLLAAAFFAAAPALADTMQYLGPVNPSSQIDGYYTGLYRAEYNNTPINVVCDDFDTDIQANQSWTTGGNQKFNGANITNSYLLGLNGGQQFTQTQDYNMAEYLAAKIFQNPSDIGGTWNDLSVAIWSINSSSATGLSEYNTSNVQNLLLDAYNNMNTSTPGFTVYDPSISSQPGQEFLSYQPISTPEPSTALLVGLGLIGFALLRSRKFKEYVRLT